MVGNILVFLTLFRYFVLQTLLCFFVTYLFERLFQGRWSPLLTVAQGLHVSIRPWSKYAKYSLAFFSWSTK